MIRLFRLYIEDKKIINQVWWGDPKEETMVGYRSAILNVFPNEIWPDTPHIFGIDTENEIITIHQCTKPEGPMQHDIMFRGDFHRYIYDIENEVKTYEMFYAQGNAVPIHPVPSNIKIKYISDMFDENFNNLDTQSLYVQGSLSDIYKWADKLSPNISKPISVGNKLHPVDSIQFKFNREGRLANLRLFAHTERTAVRGPGKSVQVEYGVDYHNELLNVDESALVQTQYDINGYRIGASVVKDDLKVYAKVPIVPLKGKTGKFQRLNGKQYEVYRKNPAKGVKAAIDEVAKLDKNRMAKDINPQNLSG